MKICELRTNVFFYVVLFAAFLFFCLRSTYSGLWYDEGIEYYFSKILSGPVLSMRQENMYERICFTYQPPLYNVVMYLWLQIFDSEFGFRLAGILFALAATIGIYKTVLLFSENKWATITALIYVFTSCIVYYALECAEYGLMLTCICWTLYFFCKTLLFEKNSSLVFFFLFSSCSVYSQYGAAFLISALAVVLFCFVLKKKNGILIKRFLCLACTTVVFAVIPLVVFFLIPQMMHQGSVMVDHSFQIGKANFVYDVFRCCFRVIYTIFSYGARNLLIAGVVPILFVCSVWMCLKRKNTVLQLLFIVLALTFVLYYIAVATSFYGYNNWAPNHKGTQNIGGRYCLFFAPPMILFLSTGIYEFMNLIKERISSAKYSKIYLVLFCVMLTIPVGGIYNNFRMKKKADVREVVQIWMKENLFSQTTLVHDWDHAVFQFYVTHDSRYQPDFQQNLFTTTPIRPKTSGEMEQCFSNIESRAFYFVCPFSCLDVLKCLVNEKKWKMDILYEGMSVFVFIDRT